MPDYLGKDQRKTHDDDEKEDAPIKGNFYMFQSFEINGIWATFLTRSQEICFQ